MRRWLFLVALCSLVPLQDAVCQTDAEKPPFQIVTPYLPLPVAGQPYYVPIRAVGGQRPYQWSIQGAPLPAGLSFDEDHGIISGRPTSNQPFSVVVQVMDSSEPPLIATKLLPAATTAPLAVTWTASPQVSQTNIAGAVRVSNGSKDTIDTTIIVVAVNELGKAFALRYERLDLPPGADSPDLKFDNNLPSGRYSVHVDAIGEVAAKNAIYRDRRQVNGLVVQ